MLSGILAVAIVLIQKAMHKGAEDLAKIEALGMPVYASVPQSDYQDKLTSFTGRKNKAGKAKAYRCLIIHPTFQ